MPLLELILESMKKKEPQSVELLNKKRFGRKNLYQFDYMMDDGSTWSLLVSYDEPVAAWDGTNGVLLKTDEYWSRTTSKHISYWSSELGIRYLGTISEERLREIKLNMDIYCPKCGEPCDTGEFLYMEEHWGQKMEPDEARRRFYAFGCQMLFSNGERNCGTVREKNENKLKHLKMRKCELDIFLKENPGAKDDDLMPHPISGEQMRMEEIRTESYTVDEELRSLKEFLFLADASDALHDLMGDDLDGIASMLGDF